MRSEWRFWNILLLPLVTSLSIESIAGSRSGCAGEDHWRFDAPALAGHGGCSSDDA